MTPEQLQNLASTLTQQISAAGATDQEVLLVCLNIACFMAVARKIPRDQFIHQTKKCFTQHFANDNSLKKIKSVKP